MKGAIRCLHANDYSPDPIEDSAYNLKGGNYAKKGNKEKRS